MTRTNSRSLVATSMPSSVPSDAPLPLESRGKGARRGLRPCAPAARPVPDREVADPPRRRRGAWRPRTRGRSAPLFLEEREVAEWARARRSRPARLLGALRLQQRRRSLERGKVRVLMGAILVHEFATLDGVIEAPTWTFDFGFDP